METLLMNLGLKKSEIRTYLALLELKIAQTGILCRTTKIASSNIYAVLSGLIEKGLVSYKVENNIKMYMPTPPEALRELYQKKHEELIEQETQMSQVITQLKKRTLKESARANYKYFEGISGIKGMWYELNQSMTPDHTVRIHTATPQSYERLVGFYTNHHALRVQKKIHEQIIFPRSDTDLASKRKNEYTDVKFLDLDNEAEWGVIEDKMYILYSKTKEPRGFLIKDEIIAKTFKQAFDQLWAQAIPHQNV